MDDISEFSQALQETCDYVIQLHRLKHNERVVPNVKPGFMTSLLPKDPPMEPKSWEIVFEDFKQFIMKGTVDINNPGFLGLFGISNSRPAVIGEFLNAAIGNPGMTWKTSPSVAELSVIVSNWIGKAIGLPECFLSSDTGAGGGFIWSTATESLHAAMISARKKTLLKYKSLNHDAEDWSIISKMVVYASEEAHCFVEKACQIFVLRFRVIPTDTGGRMDTNRLQQAIQDDMKKGLIPLMTVASSGTFTNCSFDKLDEIGPICNSADVWLHIDAAHTGYALVCPEYRYLVKGLEHCDSFTMNPFKMMLTGFDCSLSWFKVTQDVARSFTAEATYLEENGHVCSLFEQKNFDLQLGRRFMALKLWFVVMLYGIQGLQKHARKMIGLAHELADLFHKNPLFEVTNDLVLSLVCVRLKGCDKQANEKLLSKLFENGKIYVFPGESKGVYTLRFVICYEHSTSKDMIWIYENVCEAAMSLQL